MIIMMMMITSSYCIYYYYYIAVFKKNSYLRTKGAYSNFYALDHQPGPRAYTDPLMIQGKKVWCSRGSVIHFLI